MLTEPRKAQAWPSVGRTTPFSAGAQLGPRLAPRAQCARGPPVCWRPSVVAPSSCCLPWHRRIICPCCFRDINHLIVVPRGPVLPTQEMQAGVFRLLARGQWKILQESVRVWSGSGNLGSLRKYHPGRFLSVRWPHRFVPWQGARGALSWRTAHRRQL